MSLPGKRCERGYILLELFGVIQSRLLCLSLCLPVSLTLGVSLSVSPSLCLSSTLPVSLPACAGHVPSPFLPMDFLGLAVSWLLPWQPSVSLCEKLQPDPT